MTVFRIKPLVLLSLLVSLSFPVYGQSSPQGTVVPGGSDITPLEPRGANSLPIPLVAPDDAPSAAINSGGMTSPSDQSQNVSPNLPSGLQPLTAPTPPPVILTEPAAKSSDLPLSLPSTLPAPDILGKPVETSSLQSIGPSAIGLLTDQKGGLGAGMWKDTPHEIIDQLLPTINLPTSSPTLNNLAARLLLTTAFWPDRKDPTAQSMTSVRIKKLVELSYAADAWNLSQLAKPDQVDDSTFRLALEAGLVSSANKDVCTKLPDLVKMHKTLVLQQATITCQLLTGDLNGAQLGLDVLRTENSSDESFIQLADDYVTGGTKPLPPSLAPLKPLNLVLLGLINHVLPNNVYVKPDAYLVPDLVKLTSQDEKSSLLLAEKSAASGILTAAQLASVYQSTPFSTEILAHASDSQEVGPKLRAVLYQALQTEKTPEIRNRELFKFLQSLNDNIVDKATAQILASTLGDDLPSSDQMTLATSIARIFFMSGNSKNAVQWLRLARSLTSPDDVRKAQDLWPFVVIAELEGFVKDDQSLDVWLDTSLKNSAPQRREQIANCVMILEAAGFPIPENSWIKIIGASANSHHTSTSSALLLERLRQAGAQNRRGETILLSLVVASGDPAQEDFSSTLETIRALRLIGLTPEAMDLARESLAKELASTPIDAGNP